MFFSFCPELVNVENRYHVQPGRSEFGCSVSYIKLSIVWRKITLSKFFNTSSKLSRDKSGRNVYLFLAHFRKKKWPNGEKQWNSLAISGNWWWVYISVCDVFPLPNGTIFLFVLNGMLHTCNEEIGNLIITTKRKWGTSFSLVTTVLKLRHNL